MDAWTLVARLGLDTSDYENNLNKAKSNSGGLGKALTGAMNIGVAAIGAATTAAIAFGGASVKTGMEFDSAMSQVAATMGMTVEEMNRTGGSFEKLRNFAQEMGSTTKYTATESAEALNYMALAGYDAQTSMSMLPNVMNLASAGGMDLARASDMITDSQTALGLSLEDTENLVDQMAKAAATGNTSVEQLGDAILTVGANAKVMKGGTVELSAALTALADNGIKGAEGGTKLRNVLLGIQNKKFDKTFGKMGVKAYDAAGNLRALPDILNDMNKAMKGMTQAQKTDLISKTFNKADLAAVNALLDTSTDRWGDLTTAIEDSSGAAQTMAEVQLDNLEGDITLFKSALDGAKIAISDELTPTLREMTQFGTDAVSKLSEAFRDGGLTGAMEALGTLLSTGLNMVIEKLPSFIKAGMDLLGALGQGLLDNLPVIIDSAVTIIETLIKGIVGALPQLVDGGLQIILGLAGGISEMLPELIPTIVDVVIKIVDTLIENVDMLVDAALQIITALADGLLNALPTLMAKAPTIIQKLIDALIQNFPKVLHTGVQIVFKLIDGIVQNLPALVQGAVQIISRLISYIAEHLPEIIKQGFDLVVALIKGIGDAIPQLITAAWDIVNGLWQTIESYDWLSIGRNVIDGISNGIRNAAGAVWEALKSAIKSAWDGALDFLGIASPSKKARDIIGKNWALGIGEGFKRYMPIDEMVASVAEAFDEIEQMSPEIEGHSFGNDMLVSTDYDEGYSGGMFGGFEQNVNIYSPEALSPYEVARQTRIATRGMVLALRGA